MSTLPPLIAKTPILRDPAQQATLDEKGFVKLVLGDGSIVDRLRECYARHEARHVFTDGGFHHTTHHTADWELIDHVNTDIQDIMTPVLPGLFQNVEVLAANFMIKDPGLATEFVPHQDWTLMDESKFYSVNLWIPLQDVTSENGSLHFLPGSHRIADNIRTAPDFPELFGNVMPLVYPHLESVPLRVGEAILFQCAVLHGSFSNVSKHPRTNAMVGLYSKGAYFSYHYNTTNANPTVIERYDMPPEQFLRFRERSQPDFMAPTKVFPYRFPVLTEQEFKRYYPAG
jgi:ectoine hydroxylase-related dioxygenase (phytanoyl-CoA dioxygenase family)